MIVVNRILPLIQGGRWVNDTEQLQGDVEVHVFLSFSFLVVDVFVVLPPGSVGGRFQGLQECVRRLADTKP